MRKFLPGLLLLTWALFWPAMSAAEAAFEEEARKLNQQAVELYQAGRYQDALPLVQQAQVLMAQARGPEHPDLVPILNNLAEICRALGRYDQALPLSRKALEIREKALGPEHPDTATSLNNLAGLYRILGSSDQALPLYQRALKIREQAFGANHPLTANSLNNLAALYHSQGAYRKALPLYQRVLKIREQALGETHPDTATSLNNLAEVYEELGDYRQALPLARRALALKEQALGPDHPELAVCLNNLAMMYQGLGDYPQALKLAQRALELREKSMGPEHPDTGASLNNLAGIYEDQGNYDKALDLYQRALSVREKALGPEHPDTGSSLNNLAGVYQALGAYARALPLYERALAVREKALGPEHPGTAVSLNNLAGLYRAQGTYDRALALYQRALAVREKALGPEHPATAVSLNNLAELYDAMGAQDQALPLYQRAVTINEKALGPEHPRTATSLSNLGLHYKYLGAYDQALPLFERALEIKEKALGPEHPDTAGLYNNLAMLYQAMGLSHLALPFYQRALKAVASSLGPEHPYARTLSENLGFLYLERQDYSQAEACFKKAGSAYGLVELALARRQPEQALELLKGHRPTWRDLPTRQVMYHTQHGLALAATGRRGEAARALWQAVTGVEDLRWRVPGERAGFFQAGIYGGYVRPYRGLMAVLAEMFLNQEPLPPELVELGEDAAEAAFLVSESTKARALLETLAQAARRHTRAELPPELRAREERLLTELGALEAQWEKALQGGEEALKEVQGKKARLRRELDSLVQQLQQDHPIYAALYYPRPLPASRLPLGDREVLLEYALGEESSYLFVVKKGGIHRLIRIPLGRGELEHQVKAFMEPLLNRQPQRFSLRAAQELYQLLLAEALREVPEDGRLLVVPDGILGLLPFEALALKVGRGLGDSEFVGDRYIISYYQSAAVLALKRRLPAPQAGRRLFALGNPVFSHKDPRCGSRPGAVRGLKTAAFRALALKADWGKTHRGAPGIELLYPPLPETEAEVLAIARLLGVEPRAPDVLLNLEANETRLRQVPLKDYRYLHFATHADTSGKVQGIGEPFLLLGQVGNQGQDRGFLTLSQVLDLKLKAEMVVLSACLTGKGRLMEGEGVANFARAFLHAGAQSVVVSLWEVASLEAVDYMRLFYARLKEGRPRAEALQLARRVLKLKYPSPFFWAVFVLHGEG